MSDYMPVNILEFAKFVHNIRTQAAANCTRWNISMAEINELDPLIAALDATVAVSENPTTRTNAAICKREEARNALKVQLRPFIQGRLKHNLRVTNDDLISMNLSVPDRKLTPAPDPTGRPTLEIQLSAPGIIGVKFFSADQKGRAKPHGMRGIELRWILGDKENPPVNWSSLMNSESATRSPMRFAFEGHDRGKCFFFAARWENTRCVKGPWTEIMSVVIP